MKYFAIIAASLLFAGTASAIGFGNDNNGGDTEVNQDVDVRQTVDQDVEVRNTNTNVNTNVVDADAKATSIQGQGQEQEQGQGQFQAQGNSQKLTIEDAKNPASSAANLYLANCTSGASAQGFGGGGSVGGPDEVCLLLNLAIVSATLGDAEGSKVALDRAARIMTERTNPFLRFLQMFPVIRRVI